MGPHRGEFLRSVEQYRALVWFLAVALVVSVAKHAFVDDYRHRAAIAALETEARELDAEVSASREARDSAAVRASAANARLAESESARARSDSILAALAADEARESANATRAAEQAAGASAAPLAALRAGLAGDVTLTAALDSVEASIERERDATARVIASQAREIGGLRGHVLTLNERIESGDRALMASRGETMEADERARRAVAAGEAWRAAYLKASDPPLLSRAANAAKWLGVGIGIGAALSR